MKINKKGIIIATSIIFCALIFYPKFAYAGPSISLTGGAWAIGKKSASVGSASSGYTVTNDNSAGSEDILIKVGNSSPANWTPSATASPGTNKFVLQLTNSSGAVITGSNTTLASGLANNGTSSFTLYFTTPTTGSDQGSQTITVTLTAANWAFTCGDNITVNHTAGSIAPVTKTVTYETVSTNLAGPTTSDYKCWIIQNLGADHKATTATDGTEASAGWYWQFNLKQGYKHDGTTRTPAATWITSVSGDSDWSAVNDPCTIELGSGWRLPTYNEWNNANTTGAWSSYTNTFASALKLHAAGQLNYDSGALFYRGTGGGCEYWSSTQGDNIRGWNLAANNLSSSVIELNKAYGFSVRCIKD